MQLISPLSLVYFLAKMSFGFGIGDAITVGNLILRAWKTCAEAPDKVDEAAEDVKLMMDNLQYLGKMVGKPDSFVKTKGRKM